jgi:hypothetical protein
MMSSGRKLKKIGKKPCPIIICPPWISGAHCSVVPLTEMSTRNLPGGKGRPVTGRDLAIDITWSHCPLNPRLHGEKGVLSNI